MSFRVNARDDERVTLNGNWSTRGVSEAHEGSVVVAGGVGSKAAFRFNGHSVSAWGSGHAKPGASLGAKVVYRCLLNRELEWRTNSFVSSGLKVSRLCQTPHLPPGQHLLEVEIEELVDAEVALDYFSIDEKPPSHMARQVTIPVHIIEVVEIGPVVSVIGGTTTTVGWTPTATRRVTTTLWPSTTSRPSPTPTPTPPRTTTTPRPPSTSTSPTPNPRPPPPTSSPTPTPPPPTPEVTSQSTTSTPTTSDTVSSADIATSSEAPPNGDTPIFATFITSRAPGESPPPEGGNINSSNQDDGSGMSPGAIVGIALGSLAIVAVASIIAVMLYLRKKRKKGIRLPPSAGIAPYNTLGSLPGSPGYGNTSGTPLYDTPHSFGYNGTERKVPPFGYDDHQSVYGGSGSGSSAAGSGGIPVHQAYAPIAAVPYTSSPDVNHAFLQQDPMVLSDDEHSASPPAYRERPPTYREPSMYNRTN